MVDRKSRFIHFLLLSGLLLYSIAVKANDSRSDSCDQEKKAVSPKRVLSKLELLKREISTILDTRINIADRIDPVKMATCHSDKHASWINGHSVMLVDPEREYFNPKRADLNRLAAANFQSSRPIFRIIDGELYASLSFLFFKCVRVKIGDSFIYKKILVSKELLYTPGSDQQMPNKDRTIASDKELCPTKKRGRHQMFSDRYLKLNMVSGKNKGGYRPLGTVHLTSKRPKGELALFDHVGNLCQNFSPESKVLYNTRFKIKLKSLLTPRERVQLAKGGKAIEKRLNMQLFFKSNPPDSRIDEKEHGSYNICLTFYDKKIKALAVRRSECKGQAP
jgi:hypothetical protein